MTGFVCLFACWLITEKYQHSDPGFLNNSLKSSMPYPPVQECHSKIHQVGQGPMRGYIDPLY